MPTRLPNYGGLGLLAGLSKGLMSGLQAYRDERRYQDERADRERDRADRERDRAFKLETEGFEETAPGLFTRSKRFLDERDADNRRKTAEKNASPIRQELAQEGYQADFDDAGKIIPGSKTRAFTPYRKPVVPGMNLPPEDKAIVSTLATKTANKVSIANQIDSMLADWDSLSEKDRLARGRQMIKVLNSTEGQDAVGAEESKRLGGMLEFAYGNFTNDNPVQFGRDLEGFRRQAMGTSEALKGAISQNSKQVSEITGRPPRFQTQKPKAPKLDLADPRVKKAKAAGYTDAEILEYLNGR